MLIDLEPVSKRLRTDLAGNLVRRAKDLLEIGEFESAKSALDEARKYDATNLQAKSLLQEVEQELRRKELLPRLQEHLRQGRNFLVVGQYQEARRAAEHAIGLDSRFEPAHKLLGEIQEAEAAAEEIQQKLNYARRSIAMGELTEASRRIDELLSLDPDNQEAADLGAKIRRRRNELERRKKLNQYLRGTEDLLIVGKYDECIALVNEALEDFPENKDLLIRKEGAISEKAEQLRQFLLNKAKKLRASQQFDVRVGALTNAAVCNICNTSELLVTRDQSKVDRESSIHGSVPEAICLGGSEIYFIAEPCWPIKVPGKIRAQETYPDIDILSLDNLYM